MEVLLRFLGWCMFAVGLANTASAYSLSKTKEGVPIRWAVDVVATRVDETFIEMLPNDQSGEALEIALDAWRGYSGVPSFLVTQGAAGRPGYDRDRPLNGVYTVSDWPYAAEKLAVTVVTFQQKTGRLLDADVLVNGKVNYGMLTEVAGAEPGGAAAQGGDAFDLAAVLTHEVGHILGLGESEDEPEATMWPYAHPGDTHQRTLAEDDEEAVLVAYSGPPPEAAMGCGGASIGGQPNRSNRGSWALFLAGLALIGGRRRRNAVCAGGLATLVLFGIGFGRPVRIHGTAAEWSLESAALADGPMAASARTPDRLNWSSATNGPMSGPQTAAKNDDTSVRTSPGPAPRDADHRSNHTQTSEPSSVGHDSFRLGADEFLSRVARAKSTHTGRVETRTTQTNDGLWSTEVVLRLPTGDEIAMHLSGGESDGIVQRVGDLELPDLGSEILVVEDGANEPLWAYHDRGSIRGGRLRVAARL